MKRLFASILLFAPLLLASCGETGDTQTVSADSALTTEASTADADVTVSVRDGSITTAQRTDLIVRTSTTPAIDLDVPELTGDLGEWTVSPFGIPARETVNGRQIVTRTFRLEPFLPGEYEVPALTFAWTNLDTSESGELSTEPLSVTVTTVLESDDAQLSDIKGVATPEKEYDWLTIGLIAGGSALALALLAVFAVRRAMRPKIRPVDRVPAHDVALSQLDALDPSSVTSERSAVRFYSDASGVVRTYIEDRFEIRAPELTTEEFLREVSGSYDFARDDVALLERFLGLADLVKFAKHTTDASDASKARDALAGFVRRTALAGRVVVFDHETGERLRVESLGMTDGSSAGGAS